MPYAQKNFQDKIGSSDETIAESGGLIVAISNLLEQFGYAYSPSDILSVFEQRKVDLSTGIYLGAISAIEPSISVESRGIGIPKDLPSIVRLEYQSDLTDSVVVTYAAVENVGDETIIDSYDGEVKKWSIYGEPKAFVTFTDDAGSPLLVTPLKAAEKPQEPATAPDVLFTVITAINGYASAEDAQARQYVIVHFQPGTYFDITEGETGMRKLTAEKDGAGYWINPGDNVIVHEDDPEVPVQSNTEVTDVATPAPDKPAEIASEDDTSIAVRVVPKDREAWKLTWKPSLGDVPYYCKSTVTVHDLDGIFADRELDEGRVTDFAGCFTGPDGVKYRRTPASVKAGNWYGVPDDVLRRHQTDAEFEASLDNINLVLATGVDVKPRGVSGAIQRAATADGILRRIFKK